MKNADAANVSYCRGSIIIHHHAARTSRNTKVRKTIAVHSLPLVLVHFATACVDYTASRDDCLEANQLIHLRLGVR